MVKKQCEHRYECSICQRNYFDGYGQLTDILFDQKSEIILLKRTLERILDQSDKGKEAIELIESE